MTTVVDIQLSTTITSFITATETAIVQGLLDLSVAKATDASGVASTSSTMEGITLANKVAASIISSTTKAPTISTIISSSTTTSNSPISSATSISSSTTSATVQKLGTSAFSNSSTGSNANIGLIIGIPVAVIGSAILVVALYYYLRSRKRNLVESEKKLKSHYDQNFNYKMSPLNDSSSPYQLKTVYEIKPNKYYHNNYYNTSAYPSTTDFNNTSKPQIPPYMTGMNNESELSLKEPHTGPASSRWNLNTPLSKWFMKHSQVSSENSSRASLSTGPFSPILALKEFKLNKNRAEINEKSPILPNFPETSYQPSHYNYHSISDKSVGSSMFGSLSETETITKQVLRADVTKNNVPKLHPIQNHQKKKLNNKPLPEKPQTAISSSSLEGLEQRVYDRTIPTTPKVDIAKYKNDSIYKVTASYKKNLADELTISKGEFVKILARHTDGWCLGEKVDPDTGASIFSSNDKYIHDGRGVFPEMCLSKV